MPCWKSNQSLKIPIYPSKSSTCGKRKRQQVYIFIYRWKLGSCKLLAPNVVLDVREKEEFETNHLQGAVNIPLGRLLSITSPEDPLLPPLRKETVLVYCNSGVRASVAATELKKVATITSSFFSPVPNHHFAFFFQWGLAPKQNIYALRGSCLEWAPARKMWFLHICVFIYSSLED